VIRFAEATAMSVSRNAASTTTDRSGKPAAVGGPRLIERVRQTSRLLRSEGAEGISARVAQRIADRLSPPGTVSMPVTIEDLERAAQIADSGWVLPPTLPAEPGEPLTIAWVSAPPGPGSGGHTTMFRLISALEKAGHRCILYLRDRHGWALEQHERRIRAWWPWVDAEVRDAAEGIEDAHGIFATAWETAYPVLVSPARGQRFYLVQDFEPAFYPAGSEYLLAEATYRFGFHGVTAGGWLAPMLERDYGMPADPFDFGRDLSYALDPDLAPDQRNRVCFYSRPGTPRRAYELAILALELFAKRHPEVEIHFYGLESKRVPFAVTNHGLQTPEQLNALYNRSVAGLVLSATNVSLVPHEMLAAGCIPVVNDADHNRIVLDNDHVAYAPASPFELARKLSELVQRPASSRHTAAQAAAASVQNATWDEAGTTVVRIVESVVTGERAVLSARPLTTTEAS
jgi:glycosyltransferase involved in cell wall biosynthesis